MWIPLLAACAVAASAVPAPDALWGQSLLGSAGHSGQGRLDGPIPSATWPGASHLVDVKWRWYLPGTRSQFFYGGIDAAGDVFYSDTGNGAGPTSIYKLNGISGETVWRSAPLPRPTYGNFYGNDHFIVGPDTAAGVGVFVVAGTTYTLADCAWTARLDGATGTPTWWINGTGKGEE